VNDNVPIDDMDYHAGVTIRNMEKEIEQLRTELEDLKHAAEMDAAEIAYHKRSAEALEWLEGQVFHHTPLGRIMIERSGYLIAVCGPEHSGYKSTLLEAIESLRESGE